MGVSYSINLLFQILLRLKILKKFNFNVEIEIDGGLTTNVLENLKNYNINYYAGWSIINGKTLNEIENKLDNVISLLK